MKITVYFGAGGVGKTSLAAATALERARAGARCMVLTTNPAQGLAEGIHERRVALPPAVQGELWASLFDVRATLDAAVRQYAAPGDRDRILRHSIYATLADSLSGMQALMTLERIDQLRRKGFQHIVIDTATSGHALEMLGKPVLFAEFAGSNWVKLLGRTYDFAAGLGMMAMGRKATDHYAKVEAMLGSKLVREAVDFYSLFAPLSDGYAVRAQKTVALLKDPAVTEFRMVSTPQKARRDARFFSEGLHEHRVRLSRIYVNRTWDCEPVAQNPDGIEQEALEWYRCVRGAQAREIAALREEFGDQAVIRTLPELDLEGLEGLELLAQNLVG